MSNAPARTRRNTYAQCTRRDFQNTSAILRLNWIWERDAEAFLQKTVSQNKMYGHQERIEEERCLSSEERRYTFYSCRVFKLKPEWVRSVSGACAPCRTYYRGSLSLWAPTAEMLRSRATLSHGPEKAHGKGKHSESLYKNLLKRAEAKPCHKTRCTLHKSLIKNESRRSVVFHQKIGDTRFTHAE
jgi:hypothetical protein